MNLKNFTLALFLTLTGVCYGQDFTVKTSSVQEDFTISMQIVNNAAAPVTVNWGNGQSTTETVTGLEKLFKAPTGLIGTNATITIDGGGKVEIVSIDAKVDEFIVNTDNDVLWSLLINEGGLTVLDITKASALKKLSAPLNSLTSVNLTGNAALEELKLNGNSDLETITVPTSMASLKIVSLNNTKVNNASVQSILTAAPNLEEVSINKKAGEADNKLTSINLSNNSNITDLQLQNNSLSGVMDLTSCTALENTLLNNNSINSVIVNSVALTYINLNDNNVSSLDLSGAPNLVNLYCNNNELETLDLTGKTVLSNVLLNNNKLTSVTFDPALGTLNSLEIRNNFFTFETFPQVVVTAGGYLYTGQADFVISVKSNDLFSIDMSKFTNPFPAGSTVPGTAGQASDITWWGTYPGFGELELEDESGMGDYTYNDATKTYKFEDLMSTGFSDNFIYAKITNPAFNLATFKTIKVELGKSSVGIGENNKDVALCYYSGRSHEVIYNVKDAQSIRIINLSGQVVYNQALTNDAGRVSVDNLAKGIYIVQIQAADTTVKQKIVKK